MLKIGRYVVKSLIVLVILLGVVGDWACSSSPFRKRMVFTREDLQKKVAPQFPLKQKGKLIAVTFSQPLVVLEKGGDRLGLQLDVKVAPALGKKYEGRAEVDGEIEYRPDKGEFFVVDPQVRRLHIDDVPQKYQEPIRQLANKAATRFLADVPVYKLDQKNFKQSLAKLVLKSVLVENGELVVEVGL